MIVGKLSTAFVKSIVICAGPTIQAVHHHSRASDLVVNMSHHFSQADSAILTTVCEQRWKHWYQSTTCVGMQCAVTPRVHRCGRLPVKCQAAFLRPSCCCIASESYAQKYNTCNAIVPAVFSQSCPNLSPGTRTIHPDSRRESLFRILQVETITDLHSLCTTTSPPSQDVRSCTSGSTILLLLVSRLTPS